MRDPSPCKRLWGSPAPVRGAENAPVQIAKTARATTVTLEELVLAMYYYFLAKHNKIQQRAVHHQPGVRSGTRRAEPFMCLVSYLFIWTSYFLFDYMLILKLFRTQGNTWNTTSWTIRMLNPTFKHQLEIVRGFSENLCQTIEQRNSVFNFNVVKSMESRWDSPRAFLSVPVLVFARHTSALRASSK